RRARSSSPCRPPEFPFSPARNSDTKRGWLGGRCARPVAAGNFSARRGVLKHSMAKLDFPTTTRYQERAARAAEPARFRPGDLTSFLGPIFNREFLTVPRR